MADLARPPLVLYGRRYCHLCDEMVAALQQLRREFSFELEMVDVDADPQLARRYDELVPVLCCGNRELARWRLDPAVFRAYMADIG